MNSLVRSSMVDIGFLGLACALRRQVTVIIASRMTSASSRVEVDSIMQRCRLLIPQVQISEVSIFPRMSIASRLTRVHDLAYLSAHDHAHSILIHKVTRLHSVQQQPNSTGLVERPSSIHRKEATTLPTPLDTTSQPFKTTARLPLQSLSLTGEKGRNGTPYRIGLPTPSPSPSLLIL